MKLAIQIAKAFLKLSQPDAGDAISNLKLQKLLYYSQGFHLAIHGTSLFKENLIAWEHGPVVREVYDEFSHHASDTIPVPTEEVRLLEKEKELIVNVWNVYGQFSAWKLRDMTHNEMPWKDTKRNHIITLKKLEDFFKGLVVSA